MKTLVLAIGALVLVLAYQEAKGLGYYNQPIIEGQTCILVNRTSGFAFCLNLTRCPNYTLCTPSNRTCPRDAAVQTFTCRRRMCNIVTNPCPSGSVCRERRGETRCNPTFATIRSLYRDFFRMPFSRQTCDAVRRDVCVQRRPFRPPWGRRIGRRIGRRTGRRPGRRPGR